MKNLFSRRKNVATSKNDAQSQLDSTPPLSSPLDSYRSNPTFQQTDSISPPNFIRPIPTYAAPSLHSNSNPYPTPPLSNSSIYGVPSPRIASPPVSIYNEPPRINRFSTIEPLARSRETHVTEDITTMGLESKLSVSIDFGLVNSLF